MASPGRVQSVERALEILELLARAGREGLRLGSVAESLSLSRSAVWSTLQTLLARGFVAETAVGGRPAYTLGMSLARLGQSALSQMRLGEVAVPHLRSLTAKTGLTSRIAVLQGTSALVVGREDGPGAIQFNLHLGQPELLHSTAVGKAFLAAMPSDSVRELLADVPLSRRTHRTITSLDELVLSLDVIRRRGYSVDEEEDADGVVCIGACVFDHRDMPVAALSVTGLRQALPMSRFEETAEEVVAHARAFSAQLSGRGAEVKP